MNKEQNNPTKASKKTEQKSITISANEKDAEAVVYIGPTIKQIISKGTSYKGGKPYKVCELLTKYPFMLELFVPVSQLSEARKEIGKPGSSMEVIYSLTVKTIGGSTNV